MNYFLHWSEIKDNLDIRLCGGKAKNLAKLYNLDFPVPNGGVLGNSAYDIFLAFNNIKEYALELDSRSLNSMDNVDLKLELKQFQELIISLQFPEHILSNLALKLDKHDLTNSLAIRSSASAEDSKDTSFAGVHSSYLNIIGLENIIEAVKKCYASLWTLEALIYRKYNNLKSMDVIQNVIIMQMVQAKSAGVVFTCNIQSKQKDTYVINANYGLGESVVNGNIEPDEYQIDTKDIHLNISKIVIGSKKFITELNNDKGTRTSKNSLIKQVLENDKIYELTYLTKRISETISYFDELYDYEWAYDGSKFWILQVRPITTKDAFTSFDTELRTHKHIWSNANFKDILPEVISPVSWSIISYVVKSMLTAPFETGKKNQRKDQEYVKLIYGKLYFNLALMQWEYYDAFGISPEELNKGMGGHQPSINVQEHQATMAHSLNKIKLLVKLFNKKLVSKWFFSLKKKDVKKYLNKNYEMHNDKYLVENLEKILVKLNIFSKSAQQFNILAGNSYSLLLKFLENIDKNEGLNKTNLLLRGQGSIEGAEYAHELIHLTNLAAEEKHILNTFIYTKDLSNWTDLFDEKSNFYKEFTLFLNKNGHRAVSELDIINKRWRDNPEYLLSSIQQLLLTSNDILTNLNNDTTMSLSEYNIFNKIMIKFLVKMTLSDSSNREIAKSILVGYLEPIRNIVIEIGKSFKLKKYLENKDDIFYCTLAEILQVIDQKWDANNLKLIVLERKKIVASHNKKNNKDVYCSDDVSFDQADSSQDSNRDIFVGLSVSSGVAKGRVKIINSISQASEFNTGDILVAPSIDIGWLSIFLRASGIILQTGGYLSHGSIIVRELGIPAVINIPDIMSRLSNGIAVTVDGNRGEIHLHGSNNKTD